MKESEQLEKLGRIGQLNIEIDRLNREKRRLERETRWAHNTALIGTTWKLDNSASFDEVEYIHVLDVFDDGACRFLSLTVRTGDIRPEYQVGYGHDSWLPFETHLSGRGGWDRLETAEEMFLEIGRSIVFQQTAMHELIESANAKMENTEDQS